MEIQTINIKGKMTEVIPIAFAFSYAMKKEIEAVLDIIISDEDFQDFIDYSLDDHSHWIRDAFADWDSQRSED